MPTMIKDSVSHGDPLVNLPGYLVRRASVSILSGLNSRLRALDLRHIECTILQLIRANPGIRQSDIGRLLDIKRANVVPLVATLEKRRLIRRRAIDGRSQGLHLTHSGDALAVRAFSIVQTYENSLIDGMPGDLRAAVIPVLTWLWNSAEQSDADKPTAKRATR